MQNALCLLQSTWAWEERPIAMPVLYAGTCRLNKYLPAEESSEDSWYSSPCDTEAGCTQQRCREGYQRTKDGACQQVCGASLPKQCMDTATCVREDGVCPTRIAQVPYSCASSEDLVGECAAQYTACAACPRTRSFAVYGHRYIMCMQW